MPFASAGVLAGGGHFTVAIAAASAMIAAASGINQLLVDNLINPAVPILQTLALGFGLIAGVHAIAAHHSEESAALLLFKRLTLTILVEGFLVVLKNWASLSNGGNLTL